MRYIIIFILHLGTFLAPFFAGQNPVTNNQQTSHSWPVEFEGLPLTRLQLTDQERGFSEGFPGKIARFTDGNREIIIRYVEKPSRKVHPSADCFRGSGYKLEPRPISRDQNGQLWGCADALRDGITYRVCERIYDQNGNSWYDVSSWFWTTLLKKEKGPWWAITVAERI